MSVAFDDVAQVVREVLQLDAEQRPLTPNTALFGEIPEFDSMAVVTVITALEDRFDIEVDDDDISADTFATMGTLHDYVERQAAA